MRSIEQLIPKLIEHTQLGNLKWEVYGQQSRYRAELGGLGVIVDSSFDQDSNLSGYDLTLTNADMQVVDQFSADEFDERYRDLEQLHKAARRIALNVDAAIDDLERALDDLPPF